MALLSFDMQSTLPWNQSHSHDAVDGEQKYRKPWTSYALLTLVLVFILAPQPSVLLLLISYYLQTRKSHLLFLLHLGLGYFLLFVMLSSLMVTLVRDPGTVKSLEELEHEDAQPPQEDDHIGDNEGIEMSLTEALLSEEGPVQDGSSLTPLKSNGESRWCRKCWAPKPERTHHCSECRRCVLKMDHHCPWLANRCVGARTYPSFLHFLLSSTLYSTYMFCITVPPMQYFLARLTIDERDLTPYHAMTVALLGAVFSLTVGSFFIYHAYLTLTNQTTLESLAPMLLLQYLPFIEPSNSVNHATPNDDSPPPFASQPPSPTSSLSTPVQTSPPPYIQATRRSQSFAEPYRFPSPPPSSGPDFRLRRRLREDELNRRQRRILRDAAGRIRIYDLGWRENLRDALGGPDLAPGTPQRSYLWIWAERILWGGRGRGDGHKVRHSANAERQLKELAAQLDAAATMT